MRLYVCWGTFWTPRPGGHPCHNAHGALREAGWDPEVVRVQGLGIGPKALQWKTSGREEVEKLSGSPTVPVLVTDDGEVISESSRIAEWARKNPAPAPAASS
jgi:Glutathione S-transferase, N-terminal domain